MSVYTASFYKRLTRFFTRKNKEISDEEAKIIEHRGFYVKRVFGTKEELFYAFDLMISNLMILGLCVLSFIVFGVDELLATFISFIGVIVLLLISWVFILDFLKLGAIFYAVEEKIIFGKVNNHKELFDKSQISSFNNIRKIREWLFTLEGGGLFLGLQFTGIFSYVLDKNNSSLNLIELFIFTIIGTITISTTFWLLHFLLLKGVQYIYQSLHPLYAFGNLGEKIQSLTPQIEIESKRIKEELENTLEIDYRHLHHSFDTLSHTFEKIASLVIRLEKIESRANKGNLFDSKKYIGSLKDDILTPLSSLSTFLGEKETELREKQEEISKMRVQVQVGGSDERGTGETSHATLASTRIEPLIEEIVRQRVFIEDMRTRVGAL